MKNPPGRYLGLVAAACCTVVGLAACGGGSGGNGANVAALAALGGQTTSTGTQNPPANPSNPSTPAVAAGVTLLAKVSSTSASGGMTDTVYRVRVVNGATALQSAIATATSTGADVTVLDGIVRVGGLGANASADPQDTITLRHAANVVPNTRLAWAVREHAAPGAASCAALVDAAANRDLFPPNVKVTTAELVAATAQLPEHCNLLGTMNERQGANSSPGKAQTYAIKWQVRIPTLWNGRFYMPGGGGLDGSIPSTTGQLANGYAIAANDSGHDNNTNSDDLAASAGAFGTDFDARVDFAYRAIQLTTQLAKGFIVTYQDKDPQYSYFEGCSMGGREALMVTQRLPEQFDGVVAGDPALKFASVSAKSVYIAQLFGNLAKKQGEFSANGVPLASNTYTNQDLQLVSKAVLDACDALDGLTDGMVNQPLLCTTPRVKPKLDALRCTGAKTASCLTGDQIDTMVAYYDGPVTPSGNRPYYGWMWDAGIAGCTSAADCNVPGATNIATGWRTWNLGTYQTNRATAVNTASAYTAARGGAASTVVVPTPPVMPSPVANEALTNYVMNLDLDLYVSSLSRTTPEFPVSGYDLYETSSTDLSKFKAKGGKLLIYQPQTGGPFSPLAMVDYYQKLNAANGGSAFNYAQTQTFARLFMAPGMQHCSGGPSTNVSPFQSVVDWVEAGKAPDRVVGTAAASTPWPGRTRPLCPFPKTAVYTGQGSIENAENFACQ